MKQIYKEVRNWIYRNARPLDLARWQYHFENGKSDNVINVLQEYQNMDGGFGHALEEDAWNPGSSPIQTFRAVELIGEVNLMDKTHPIIQGILKYLNSRADFADGLWKSTVNTNNDYPHAQWWCDTSEPSCHDKFNPSIGLAGFGLYFADKDTDLYQQCKDIATKAIEYVMQLDEIDFHVLVCYITFMNYLEQLNQPDLFPMKALRDKLKQLVSNCINRDTKIWATNYICKPSILFRSRDSIFYQDNKDIVDIECDFIPQSRNTDGVWDITWGWAGFPEEWAITKNWWKSDLAIKNLLFYKNIRGEL